MRELGKALTKRRDASAKTKVRLQLRLQHNIGQRFSDRTYKSALFPCFELCVNLNARDTASPQSESIKAATACVRSRFLDHVLGRSARLVDADSTFFGSERCESGESERQAEVRRGSEVAKGRRLRPWHRWAPFENECPRA